MHYFLTSLRPFESMSRCVWFDDSMLGVRVSLVCFTIDGTLSLYGRTKPSTLPTVSLVISLSRPLD